MKLQSLSLYSKLLLSLSVIEAVLIITLESLISTQTKSVARGIPVYLSLFILAQVFQVVLALDALLHQNTIQIIGFVFFHLCTFAYAIFQYNQLNSIGVEGYLIAIIVVMGVSQLIHTFLAYKLYLEFGWKIYKRIGADPEMKNMFRTYQIFLLVLKLDFFFFLGFSIQFIVLVLNPSDPEFALTIIALPLTVFVLALAVYGVRREQKTLMIMFIIGCLLAMAYFIFKLARMYTPDQEWKYSGTQRFLTFFASLSLVAVIATLVISVICYGNFGKGLKVHIQGESGLLGGGGGGVGGNSSNVSGDRKMELH